MISGTTIGLYSVRRTDKPHAFQKAGWFVYDWEYSRTNDLSKRFKGSVTHCESNGAEALLEKVMAAVKNALKT